MEACEVVADTDSVGDSEVPVLPEAFAIIKDDALTKVVRSVADKLDAVAERLAVRDGFLVPVD